MGITMKYLYKKTNGAVEAKVFEDDENPGGWVDDPIKCDDKPKVKAKPKAKQVK
jgi:hypothetical protein